MDISKRGGWSLSLINIQLHMSIQIVGFCRILNANMKKKINLGKIEIDIFNSSTVTYHKKVQAEVL